MNTGRNKLRTIIITTLREIDSDRKINQVDLEASILARQEINTGGKIDLTTQEINETILKPKKIVITMQ